MTLDANVDDLKTELTGLKREIADLKIRSTDLETKVADFNDSGAEVDDLKTELAGLKREGGDLKTELVGLKGTKIGERLEIVEGENILLKKQVVTLKEEVVTLKEKVVTLKEKVVTLTTDFSDFKTESKKSSDLILLFDLICLFRLYFIQPNLSASAKHTTWGQLCQSITDATDALEDGFISDAAYRTLLTEWNSYSPDVDIILLKKWSTKRHDIAHSSMRSVIEHSL